MSFLGRWVADSLRLALALGFAVLAMQAPALTRDYADALLQVSQEARRDVDQREASARRFYGIPAGTDAELVEQLRPREPSNAETLARSAARAEALRAAWERISAAHPLTRPVVALLDRLDDPTGAKSAVLATTLATYAPQIVLDLGAALWALLGLVLGALLADMLVALLRAPFQRRAAREGGH